MLLFTHKSMLGEKLKDIGHQMLGQGAEVKFKKAAENYERTHVVSATEARRAVFNDLMDSLQQEMRLTGGIADRKYAVMPRWPDARPDGSGLQIGLSG